MLCKSTTGADLRADALSWPTFNDLPLTHIKAQVKRMKIILKLSTGKEIELTAEELKELFDQRRYFLSPWPAQPYPFQPTPYTPEYDKWKPPYIVTCLAQRVADQHEERKTENVEAWAENLSNSVSGLSD